MTLGLNSPVVDVPDVGPTNSARLAKLGIRTVRDLLLHLPFDWDEYGEPTAVAALVDGKQATVIGTIDAIFARRSKYKKMDLTEAALQDDSGGILKVVWFNQAWMAKQLHKGDRVAVAGMARGRFGVFDFGCGEKLPCRSFALAGRQQHLAILEVNQIERPRNRISHSPVV